MLCSGQWLSLCSPTSLASQTVMQPQAEEQSGQVSWHQMMKRLHNTRFSRSCYLCATSVFLALEHVPPKHFSREGVTSCSYLSLLLRLLWHLRLMQLLQSSLTRLSLALLPCNKGLTTTMINHFSQLRRTSLAVGRNTATPTTCQEANEHVSVQQTIGSFPSYWAKRLLV